MTSFVTIGKSKQFYDFLKNELLTGEYKQGDKFPSIRDLAQKYKISNITVNSVISNLVTERLLYVEQGKGTFVSQRKQIVRKGKKMIGVMFFDFRMENNVEAGIFNSIQENLKDDYFVIPYNSYDKPELFYKGLKGLEELEVDGMILVPPTDEDYDIPLIRSTLARNIPIVMINRKIPFIEGDFFSMDFTEGICKAARHLLGKGRRNIALLKHFSPSLGIQMINGFEKAYEKTDVFAGSKLILEWTGSMESAEVGLKSVVDRIDGLIASDYVIYKLRKIFSEKERKIPEDISIVGINDLVYSRFMDPPLTSVRFPSEQIGEAAIKAIMDKVDNRNGGEICKSFIPELIIRSS